MKRLACLLGLLIVVLAMPPVRAGPGDGQFVLRCPYSHSLPDDPIVAPGQPGASHLHDFFGNTGVNASSTLDSMLAGETTCRVPGDTAGYWTPAAFLDGVPITPTVMRIYYLGPAFGRAETIPAGLQMIGGNRDATSAAENPRVSWNCGQTREVKTPDRDAPYDCTPYAGHRFVDGVIAVIDFPSCWNGTGLRPEDVAYPVGGSCPPGFPRIIPKLSERVHFGIMNPLRPDGTLAMTLSSGPHYTLHADFWNTWQQDRLDQLVLDCIVARVHCGSVDATSRIEWSRQFGTQRYDLAHAAAPDGRGGTYVAGFTNFALEGQVYHHRYDAFLRRYDRRGNELWTQQFGTNGTDRALALAVSGRDVYVSGSTDGRFPKQEAKGGLDAFVARFGADGTRRWLVQFGTHRDDEAAAIAATDGALYVAGTTHGRLEREPRDGPSDAFVMRMDPDGTQRWTRQFGGAGEDAALGVSVRGTRVYAAGQTQGLHRVVADLDGFVRAMNLNGGTIWTYAFGATDDDAITAIAARAAGIYIAGKTSGTFRFEEPAGGLDAFVGKLGRDGSEVWVRQFGSPADDDAAAVALVGKGFYVAGSTLGELPEGAFLGETDGFVRKYLLNGTEVWTRQLGTDDYDRVYGMAGDAEGVVIVGTTHGVIDGPANFGDRDVFAIRVAFT